MLFKNVFVLRTPNAVAWANYTNAINSTGWSYLEVNTEERFPDKIQVLGSLNFFKWQ